MVMLLAVFYQHRYSLKIFPIFSSMPSLSHIHTHSLTSATYKPLQEISSQVSG